MNKRGFRFVQEVMLCRFAISLSTLMLSVGMVSAAPKWKQDLKPIKPGNYPPLTAGKLEYSLSWKGLLNSGKLEFDIGKPGAHKPGVIVIKSTGKSTGPGGTIFPYNGHGWSEVKVDSLMPSFASIGESKRGKHIKTELHYLSDKVTLREVTKQKKKQEVKTHVFGQSPVYDIGSAILFIRSQRLNKGDEIKLMIHPYASPYLLKAKVLGKERLNNQDCIKLSLELHKISLKDMSLKPYKKLKEPALLWFSDDGKRLPLEVRSKVFIGDIRATLEGFKEA